MHLVPVAVPEGIALLLPGSYRVCIEKGEPHGRVFERMVFQYNFVPLSVGAVKVLVIQGPYNGILSYIVPERKPRSFTPSRRDIGDTPGIGSAFPIATKVSPFLERFKFGSPIPCHIFPETQKRWHGI